MLEIHIKIGFPKADFITFEDETELITFEDETEPLVLEKEENI